MKLLYILLLSLFLYDFSFAQNNPKWKHYTSAETITCFAEGSQNIWVGTNGGLLKIDKTTGNKKLLTKANSDLPFNDIFKMVIDKQGNLWLETCNRLAKYDGNSWADYNIKNSVVSHFYDYVSMAVDSTGNVWFGTYFDGLLKYNGQTFTAFDSAYNYYGGLIKLYGVRNMAVDSAGKIWIEDTFDANILSDSLYNIYIIDTAVYYPSNYFYENKSIFKFDKQGRLWIASYEFTPTEGKVAFRDANGWQAVSDSNKIATRTTDFVDMGNGIIYFSTGNNGIIKYDGSHFTPFINKDNSVLDTNAITKLYLDKQSVLWVGTLSGLYIYKNNVLSRVKIPDSYLPTNYISYCMTGNDTKYISYYTNYQDFSQSNKIKTMKISGSDTVEFNTPLFVGHKHYEDSVGNIWFLTGYGMARLKDTTYTIFNIPQWLDTIPTDFRDFNYDKKNRKFWIGGRGMLLSFDGNSYKKEADFPNLWSDLVSVFVDSLENVWVGTNGSGIYKYKNHNWTSYNYSWTLYNDYIRIIKEDNDHNIWFSTLYGKMAKYDYHSWKVYNGSNSPILSYFWIHDFIFDKNNNLYIGTSDFGIYIYDGNHWDSLNEYNSDLPFRYAGNFSFDSHGNLWMKSNSLDVYNPNGVVLSINKHSDILSSDKQELEIYPNPGADRVTIVRDNNENFNLYVYDLQGKLLIHKKYRNQSGSITLETSSLSDGVYLVVIHSGNSVFRKKLVIQNW